MTHETHQGSLELKRKHSLIWRGAGALTLAFLLTTGLTACGDDESDPATQEETMEQPPTEAPPTQNGSEAPDNSVMEEDMNGMGSGEMADDATAEMPSQEDAMPQADQADDAQSQQPADQPPVEQGEQNGDETEETSAQQE